MKCTECNKEVKPVVAIDIDGTIGDYHKHFLEFADGYVGRCANWNYRGERKFRDWFCQEYGVNSEIWHDVKLAYRQGGMKRTMPMYPNAPYLASTVIEQGAELWITTTRPYIRHDNVDPDTREWLRRNMIEYNYLIYDGFKYEKLNDLVGPDRVVAVLDDLTEELDEALNLFGPEVPILRASSWNEARSWAPAAGDLTAAAILIRDRINQWKERHDQDH